MHSRVIAIRPFGSVSGAWPFRGVAPPGIFLGVERPNRTYQI